MIEPIPCQSQIRHLQPNAPGAVQGPWPSAEACRIAQEFPARYWSGEGPREVQSLAHLRRWIETNVYLDLMTAAFSTRDADLLPPAGACINCQKRTGANALLFDDVRKRRSLPGPDVLSSQARSVHRPPPNGRPPLDCGSRQEPNPYKMRPEVGVGLVIATYRASCVF
jgi:hypothetical protein